MTPYLLPPLFVLFVWWFSTGAILLVVGGPSRATIWKVACAVALLGGSLAGLAASREDVSVSGAYVAFTCAILLWGAQELAFLAGWVTGPRPAPCPAMCTPRERLSFALQAILYHELLLLASGAAVLYLTWGAPNPIGWWAFAALWLLRQSAKLNLFLGVRQHNDELLPAGVAFLKTYFAHRRGNSLFAVSIVAATGATALLVLAAAAAETTDANVAALMLVATLVALGLLEHVFMMLPMPVIDLWRWSLPASSESSDAQSANSAQRQTRSGRGDDVSGKPHAREATDVRFAQTFFQRRVRANAASTRIRPEPASATEGRLP